jgi:hypothetical protein
MSLEATTMHFTDLLRKAATRLLRDWLGNCAIEGKKCAIGSGEKHKSSM